MIPKKIECPETQRIELRPKTEKTNHAYKILVFGCHPDITITINNIYSHNEARAPWRVQYGNQVGRARSESKSSLSFSRREWDSFFCLFVF